MIHIDEFYGGCDVTGTLSAGSSFQFGKNRYVVMTPNGGGSTPVKMLMPDTRNLVLGFTYVVTLDNMAVFNTVSVVDFLDRTHPIWCADGVARAAPTSQQITGGTFGYPAIYIRLVERNLNTWTPFSVGDSRI